MLSRIKRILLAAPIGILGALTAMPLLSFPALITSPVSVVFGICVGTALFCAVSFGLEEFGEQEKRSVKKE